MSDMMDEILAKRVGQLQRSYEFATNLAAVALSLAAAAFVISCVECDPSVVTQQPEDGQRSYLDECIERLQTCGSQLEEAEEVRLPRKEMVEDR